MNLINYNIMKDKETTNLVLIMVVSIVLLLFLYLSPNKQKTLEKNLSKAKNEIPAINKTNKLNSTVSYK